MIGAKSLNYTIFHPSKVVFYHLGQRRNPVNMYNIESAYGIARAQGAQWDEQDVSTYTGVQLYTLFRRLYLTLSTDLLVDPVPIDIADFQAILAYDTRLVSEIFAEWTDTSPLKTAVVPKYKAVRAIYTDILRAGYTAHKSIPGAHYTSSQDDKLRTEMQLSRVGTDMQRVEQFCLVVSNGYFYRVEATRDVAYVPEAGKSLLKSKANHVGILSFEKIGAITTHSITEASILSHTPGAALYDGANVPLPNVNLTNKTLLLVLGGYLHFQIDGVFKVVGDARALIRPGAVPMLERLRESHDKIDWSSVLGEPSDGISVDAADLRSDATLKKYLTHPQTFWVVVDTPHLAKARMPLWDLPMPGQFISATEPKELLVAGTGYVLEYWKRQEHGEWAVNCSGVRPGRSIAGTIGRQGWDANASLRNVPYIVYNNIQAHLLDIIADEIPA